MIGSAAVDDVVVRGEGDMAEPSVMFYHKST
jgi:hypothetical protein